MKLIFRILSLLTPLLLFGTMALAQMDTVLIDFGTSLSPGPWNNLSTAQSGAQSNLINSAGMSTGIGVAVVDAFNGVNTSGTTMPDPASGFVPTATSDSYFGNTVLFGGFTEPTGALAFSNLNPAKPYTVVIIASRMSVNDNRETQYELVGQTTSTLYLNASNNVANTVSASLLPDADGSIRINVTPGPNNNNANGFYYIGALKLIYEHEVSSTPASLSLLSPIGGEYWQAGKSPSILWSGESLGNVSMEYSTDQGANWIPIGTAPGYLHEYPWAVPHTASTDCKLRLSFDTLTATTPGLFEIAEDSIECRIVVLGSSTAAGAGPSSPDSAWVNRYRKAIFQKNTRFSVTNLAMGGYTSYHILPTGTPIPPGVNISIDQQRNITKAMSFNPSYIIVNMPSNDAANNFSVEAQLANFALVANTAYDGGADIWMCTTQPRNFTNSAQIQIQTAVRDSIFTIYGDHAIDFWTGIADSTGFIAAAYNSGDGIHLNNAGHRILVARVLDKGIDTLNCAPMVSAYLVPAEVDINLKVFPNPFENQLSISFDAVSVGWFELRISDMLGRTLGVFEDTISTGGRQQFELPVGAQLGGQSGQVLLGTILIRDDRGLSMSTVLLMKQ